MHNCTCGFGGFFSALHTSDCPASRTFRQAEENQAELERHHRDFAAISKIIEDVLAPSEVDFYDLETALKKIRGIVG